MTKKHLFFLIVCSLFLISEKSFSQITEADRLNGEWYTEDNKSIVKIYRAVDGKYYGKIIWLKEPLENGKPKVDDENPDPKLQSRPIIGLLILKGFVYEGDGVWWDGTIYDPESGNTYNCKITLTDINTLDVRGYIGKSWMGLGRTTVWVRKK